MHQNIDIQRLIKWLHERVADDFEPVDYLNTLPENKVFKLRALNYKTFNEQFGRDIRVGDAMLVSLDGKVLALAFLTEDLQQLPIVKTGGLVNFKASTPVMNFIHRFKKPIYGRWLIPDQFIMQ
jgi:hypothetical protein